MVLWAVEGYEGEPHSLQFFSCLRRLRVPCEHNQFPYSPSWLIRAMSSFCSSLPTLVKYALYPVIRTSRVW